MDKEEARFVLRCFRPDGSDASEPAFAEALQLAATDRELGDWLARERAQDGEFSELLGTLPLPEGLREEILAGLAAERGDLPQADEMDAALIGALATVRPPEGFRDEILAAMDQSQTPPAKSEASSKLVSWWKFGLPLAAAAGIAVAFMISGGESSNESGQQLVSKVPASGSAIPVSFVEEQAISTLESPDFSLDLMDPDQNALFEFIRSQGRSCPSGSVPKGLIKVDGLGCRTIEFNGKPGAIICFKKGENEMVHLVVFRRADVAGELPASPNPELEQQGDWAVARWAEEGRVFMLLGQTDTESLGELF